MPSKDQFERECRKLGINNSSHIVVFDDRGIYSSPRVWWMLQTMGHARVSALDGGMPAWIEQDLPTEVRTQASYDVGDFKATLKSEHIVGYEQIRCNMGEKHFTLIDARSDGRYNGTDTEPRAELCSGHISGSVNIPYQDVLSDGKYKSQQELKATFDAKCDTEQKLVFSCGSGVTACIVLLASELALGKSNRYVYDGSWTEWATKNDLRT